MAFPCKDCSDRQPACHDHCEKYKAEKDRINKYKADIIGNKDCYDYDICRMTKSWDTVRKRKRGGRCTWH